MQIFFALNIILHWYLKRQLQLETWRVWGRGPQYWWASTWPRWCRWRRAWGARRGASRPLRGPAFCRSCRRSFDRRYKKTRGGWTRGNHSRASSQRSFHSAHQAKYQISRFLCQMCQWWCKWRISSPAEKEEGTIFNYLHKKKHSRLCTH